MHKLKWCSNLLLLPTGARQGLNWKIQNRFIQQSHSPNFNCCKQPFNKVTNLFTHHETPQCFVSFYSLELLHRNLGGLWFNIKKEPSSVLLNVSPLTTHSWPQQLSCDILGTLSVVLHKVRAEQAKQSDFFLKHTEIIFFCLACFVLYFGDSLGVAEERHR